MAKNDKKKGSKSSIKTGDVGFQDINLVKGLTAYQRGQRIEDIYAKYNRESPISAEDMATKAVTGDLLKAFLPSQEVGNTGIPC